MSKDLQFFFSDIAEKMHNGGTLEILLLFLPIKNPCHPKWVSLTMIAWTKWMPKSEKQLPMDPCLSALKEDAVHGFFLNITKKHLLTKDYTFLLSWSRLTPFPFAKTNFRRHPWIPNYTCWKRNRFLWFKGCVKIFIDIFEMCNYIWLEYIWYI